MKGLFMSLIWIVAIIAGAYIAFAGFFFIFQSQYVYYPERVLSTDPSSIGLNFESVSFETRDGAPLSGWFVPSENARGVVLFCHGNAGNISHRLESIMVFNQLGLDILIFDYRGYGQSEGKPSENGAYRDAEAAWHYLVEERQVNPSNIIIFGRSLFQEIWIKDKQVVAVKPQPELEPFFQLNYEEFVNKKFESATPRGFEPLISTVTGWHVCPLHHGAILVQGIVT